MTNSFYRKWIILGILFLLPVIFLLFLYPSTHNYNTLDIVNEDIKEIDYLKNVLPIAKDKGIPLIATNDVLFAEQDDYEIHETKVCINTGKTLNDPNRERVFSEHQYFKSPQEMMELFKDYDSLIDNTNEISKKCNVSLETKGYFLPEYPVPKKHNFD